MWSKINTRRLAPQMAIAWNLGFGKPFLDEYGASIRRTFQYFDGKSTDYFVDSEEYASFNRRLEHLIGNQNFLLNAYPKAKRFLESVLDWAQKHFGRNLSNFRSKELAKLYEKFALELEPQFYARMWMVYRISNPMALAVERKILSIVKDEKKTAEYMRIFSSPLASNNVIEECIDASKIAKRRGKIPRGKFDELIRRHAREYAYIPMYGFDHQPFSRAHFSNEISKIKSPGRELSEIEFTFKRRKTGYLKAFAELKPSPKLKQLLNFFSDMIFLRDYRDMIREKLNFTVQRFYLECGRRARLGLEETNLLTNDEIIGFLGHGIAVPKQKISDRRKRWAIIQEGGIVKIFGGREAGKLAEKELGKAGNRESHELKGSVGSVGLARGKVRIVHTNKNLPDVKNGEIMVTSMTRQDFVPYLRMCAALVTDEGGITSHAAIICREIGLPCIVGTEDATKTFKNGDLVEVDATKGIVRKITQSELSRLRGRK